MRAVLKNIPKKDKKEVAYMLKDSLEDECKMQELAVILDDRGAKSQQTRLIASDLIFGTTNRFLDSTGGGFGLPTAWKGSTRN